jgi:hypothetical protein
VFVPACSSGNHAEDSVHIKTAGDANATEGGSQLAGDAAVQAAIEAAADSEAAAGQPSADGGSANAPTVTIVEDEAVGTGGLYHCPSLDGLTQDSLLAGVYSGDQHWQGIIRVTDQVSVDSGTITIDPGTLFIMEASTSLVIGGTIRDQPMTTLAAKGTAERPIRFCGSDPTPGSWNGAALLGDLTTDSAVENWLVDGGGGNQSPSLALEADLVIKNVHIRNAGWDGIAASTFGDGSQGLAVEGAKHIAVVLHGVAAVTRFPPGSKFENNTQNVAMVAVESVREPVPLTFHAIGIPYLQPSDLVVGAGSCTFEAGVEYRFGQGAGFSISSFGDSAELQVKGTEEQPVLFRGDAHNKGFWRGFRVGTGLTSASTISNAVFTDGGAVSSFPLVIGSPITIENIVVRDSAAGVQLSVPPSADSKSLSSTGNDGYALSVSAEALVDLPTGGTFTDNGKNMIEVAFRQFGPAVRGTIRNLGMPYHLNSVSFTENDDSLEVEPGTEFVFAPQAKFEIGAYNTSGKFVAVGTTEGPIVFRGESNTNGAWGGLLLNARASADSRLDHATLAGAGLALLRPVVVQHSHFSGSASYGITKMSTDTSDYASTNTFSDNTSGDVGNF